MLESVGGDGHVRDLMIKDGAHALCLRIQLWATPAKGIPTLSAQGSEDAIVAPKNIKQAKLFTVLPKAADDLGSAIVCIRTPAPSPPDYKGYAWDQVKKMLDFSDLSQACILPCDMHVSSSSCDMHVSSSSCDIHVSSSSCDMHVSSMY